MANFKVQDSDHFPTTCEELEAALDAGKLYVHIRGSSWWQVRRNGKTQTWKRDAARFRIPIKAGFRATGELTQGDLSVNRKEL